MGIYKILDQIIISKKTVTLYKSITVLLFLVDNSLEISNISLTPRDFELAIKMIKLIVENENKYIFKRVV